MNGRSASGHDESSNSGLDRPPSLLRKIPDPSAVRGLVHRNKEFAVPAVGEIDSRRNGRCFGRKEFIRFKHSAQIGKQLIQRPVCRQRVNRQ